MAKVASNTYPLLTLRNTVIFPLERATMLLEAEAALQAVESALRDGGTIVVAAAKAEERSSIAVLARVLESSYLSPTVLGVVVEGIQRARLVDVTEGAGFTNAKIKLIPPSTRSSQHMEALARSIVSQLKQLAQIDDGSLSLIISQLPKKHPSPEEVSDFAGATLRLSLEEKLQLLTTEAVEDRLIFLNQKVAQEVAVAQLERKIQNEVQQKVGEEQRHFYLREHLKAIEKELGVGGGEEEFIQLERQINEAKLPPDVARRANQELGRLRTMPAASAEAPYIRTYLSWLIEAPWTKRKKARLNIRRAEKVLNAEHYGLEKPKNRILEYLAVEKLTRGKHRGSIMCFVGPPGTGKTSVGKSIAEAMGRDFVRVSLGGVRDEAEIRGHRRTYVGALPGRIIQGLKQAGSNNPVFMLDEIDKLGADFRGDPAAALLEVLDPQQNQHFSDHYLELPFDLSNVIFIATANMLDPVPGPLRDRMEVIEFSAYTEDEKFHIAKTFIMPRVLAAHGLAGGQLRITADALRAIIHHYTREAGVRSLERRLAEISRKVARQTAQKRLAGAFKITAKNVADYLGVEEFEATVRETIDTVGVATGLAWMPTGGEIIFIETRPMPGSGKLTLTGQLGKVMQESAKAALSYVRSRSRELGFPNDFYQHTDIHVHVPSGAIPKDGPSAGAAIAVALTSALTNQKVKSDVAVTGEISLTGKVLPVGGIKEKVLAAHRAGIKTVILPRKNQHALADIPSTVREDLRIILASHMDEILTPSLARPERSAARPSHVATRRVHEHTAFPAQV